MTALASKPAAETRRHTQALTLAAFISGLCSIIYELLIATTASYFLGDSVKYFSLTIGIYMAAMGVGTLLSKYIAGDLLRRFVQIELALAVLGGMSVPGLYVAYAFTGQFLAVYLFFTISIGLLIGLEIPFLTRLMERYCQLRVNIANILSFDYFGALIATVSFPFLLLPFLGVYQSSLAFGLVNMAIAFLVLGVFGGEIGAPARRLRRLTLLLTLGLGAMLLLAHQFLAHWDQSLYDDRIIHSEQTRYQRIVLTRDRQDVRLYLDGNLQFSSVDEYRYHEALVQIPLAVAHRPVQRVLLLGAGDGLAVRELLKHKTITEITVVDLDPMMTQLGRQHPAVVALNGNSLADARVRIKNADAFGFLQQNRHPFDLIIADLPDPNNTMLARLYSKPFYSRVRDNLTPGGLFVTQATSPYFAPQAFWSIAKTIAASGFATTIPYHAEVPSFGDWGFVLASEARPNLARPVFTVPTRYVERENFSRFFVFDKDTRVEDVEVNLLDRPILLDYYLQGWRYYR